MEANEFVGFTLPVVNAGPWSYFSNGGVSEDGEDETMIVDGSYAGSYFTIDETCKNIYDAIASGKIVIVRQNYDGGSTYSLITEAIFSDDTYTFYITLFGVQKTLIGTENDNPTEDIAS